jgi:hypothetical protein
MQYSLSTLFLVIFVYATSLAAFGPWGILVASIFCAAAVCLNWAKDKFMALLYFFMLIFFALCCGGLLMQPSIVHEPARREKCQYNMKQLGLAVLNYENSRKKFPPVYVRGKEGEKHFSWLVNILPYMEYGVTYDALNKKEPWDSTNNAAKLTSHIEEFECPSVERDNNDYSCNYLAIIGPGTIWKEDGAKTVADLPHGTSNTIIAVETVNPEKHWAEPFALTVDEVLENMKTKKGVRISTNLPDYVNAVFADGAVRRLPSEMPLSLWRKVLNGEIADIDRIADQIDPYAEDMINVSTQPILIHGLPALIVWLLSVIWLFRRAWKSREPDQKSTPVFDG